MLAYMVRLPQSEGCHFGVPIIQVVLLLKLKPWDAGRDL